MQRWFAHAAQAVTDAAGSVWALVLAGTLILGWIATGPAFGFSDTWQLIINTSTTIITFLMVFVIQSTTNRESRAIQIKLDELIRAVHDANKRALAAEQLLDLEQKEELERYRRMGNDEE
jgi:low affinity Fe/Cu permease